MKCIFTFLWIITETSFAIAQFGEITGKLLDENDQVLPLASVSLVDNRGVFTGRGTTCNHEGIYSIKQLPVGKYNVQFSYVGYVSQVQKGIRIDSGKAAMIDVKLRPSIKELKLIAETFPSHPPLNFKLRLIEKRDTISSNYIIRLQTEKIFSRHVSLHVSLVKDKSTFIININGITTDPEAVHGGSHHVEADVDIGKLPHGTYKVFVSYKSDTAKGIIKIKNGKATFTLDTGFASTEGIQKLLLIPEKTLWGFVLYNSKEDSVILIEYLNLLKKFGCSKKKITSGDYKDFQIDENGKFSVSNNHGWKYEYGFIFSFNSSFEELRALTQKFIYVKGDDKVDIILNNDKGAWFSEVR